MVVEIDGPGHAASWCKGYPEICPAPDCPQPLNPAVNATFDVLHDLYFDLTGGKRGAGLFFDNIMHLGGDEVNTDCWTNTPAVADWLKEKGFTADQAYMYFVQRAQKIAQSMGRDVVGWEEIWNHFGTQLAPETIIQQWLPGSSIAVNATAHGYRVIWSTDGVWYLDGLGVTWDKMYEQEPCTGIDDKLCEQYVLGGGGEMWGETVDTGDVLFTIWPRMGAIAERLWSPRDITDKSAALPRIMNFRCLLNRRGISAAPVDNSQARTAPPGPGSCFAQ
jgi:hexosaminidase